MTPRNAWRLLGVAATDESRAIRHAYATQLRALDVDKDRNAFAALREARDCALAIASQAAGQKSNEEHASAPLKATEAMNVTLTFPSLSIKAPLIRLPADTIATLSTPVVLSDNHAAVPLASDCRGVGTVTNTFDVALPTLHSPASAFGGAIAQRTSTDRPDQGLHAILYPGVDSEEHETKLEPEEVAQASALIDRLYDDARHGAIELYVRIETWLSDELAGAWPRSHPLLPHAVALFGWAAREGQIDVPVAIDFINRRVAADRFAQAVRERRHRLNRAWRQLARPTRPGQGRALWRDRKKINELLDTIRRDYPELESQFDWHRVALWENRTSGFSLPIGRSIWIGILVLQLLGAVARYSNEQASTPVEARDTSTLQDGGSNGVPLAVTPRIPGGLGDVDIDMRKAITASLGDAVTSVTLRERAPLVYALFESNWRVGIDMGRTRAQYVETMVRVIGNRYALLARQAGGNDLIGLQRQRIKEERLLKGSNWKACADVAAHGGLADPALIPAKIRDGRRETVTELILAMPENPAPHSGGLFSIPGKIVARTVETSGLTLGQVTTAFQRKESDREKCLTHIALLNAALAADPKTRAALLSAI